MREGTGTEKGKEASRFLKLREGAVATGAAIPPRIDRVLYDELAEDLRQHYRTTGRRQLDEVEDRLRYLDQHFRGWRASRIGPAELTAYVAARQAEKTKLGGYTSNRTINIELALLKPMLRLGYKQGKVMRVPPIEMLKEAPARQGFFEPEQYEAVRRRLRPDLQVAAAIAHTFGWRVRSEVLTLERRHVDLHVGTMRLDPGMTKNGEGRLVYLTPELKRLLAQQLSRVDQLGRQTGRIVPWVFPHLRGRRAGQRRTGFTKAWQTACEKGGVRGKLLHDFRRTAVRNLERAGVPSSVAMKITGHKTESVYRRYAIVSDAELREATQRLTGTFSGTSEPAHVDSRVVNTDNDSHEALAQPG